MCLSSWYPHWPWLHPVTEPGFLSSWGSSRHFSDNCLITSSFSQFPGGGLLTFAAAILPTQPQCLAGDRPGSRPWGGQCPRGRPGPWVGLEHGMGDPRLLRLWVPGAAPEPFGWRESTEVQTRPRPRAASRGIYVTASERCSCLIPVARQLRCQMLQLH